MPLLRTGLCRSCPVLLLLTSAFAAPVGASALPALSTLAQEDVQVSAMVVDLHARKPMAVLHPHQRLIPASVSKLYATAASLERWGPNHRFTTHLRSDGTIRQGTLHGDLVYAGAGDPGINTEALQSLVLRLRQAGVTHIAGNIVVNNSLFGYVPCATQDHCEALTRSGHAYDAPLSSAGINFNVVEVTVIPGIPGQPAMKSLLPPNLRGVRLSGAVETRQRGAQPFVRLHRRTSADEEVLHVGGWLPEGHPPLRAVRSIARPEVYAGQVLKALLEQNGIGVDGGIVIDSRPPARASRSLASVDSAPMSELLQTMMRYSNNYMADTLTLHLLAEQQARPENLSLPIAARKLELLAHRVNGEAGLELEPEVDFTEALVLDSGSGLTVTSRLSAHDVVSLLAAMYRRSADFPTFYASLTVPEHANSRMLRGGNPDFARRVSGKTGLLTEPVSVRSFAGYLRLPDGGWGAFAIIINGTESRPLVPGPELMAAIRSDLEALLQQPQP